MSESLPWWKHQGGHLLIAAAVAFFGILCKRPLVESTVYGAVGSALVIEVVQAWERGWYFDTREIRDHVADLLTYQFLWVPVLASLGLWAWAGAVLVALGLAYWLTLRWSKPGPYIE